MQLFSEFFKVEMQKRHMHPIGRDVSSHPKHAGRFVPHMHRTKMENAKLARLKNGNSTREVLHPQDIRELQRVFRFDLDPNHEVKLGNTQIRVVYDRGHYYLVK
jgi:hypothetical protein